MLRWGLLFSILGSCTIAALAQDPFEIQVYEYETVKKGTWDLETHMNFTGKGSKDWEGPVAPSNHQFHTTFELTRGVTDHFEFAGYLLFAGRSTSNTGIDWAGVRFRPRYSVPESVGLPFRFSIGGEVDFQPTRYSEDSVSMEIRPVIERAFGHWQFDFNPAFGRALRGPGTAAGWEFEPAARVAYKLVPRFEPSLEYYSSVGPVRDLLPRDHQVHLLFPGGDLKLNESTSLNLGFGLATTPAGDRFIMKARLSWEFGGKAN